uniref:Uncharacterized protein n=1 Tax=Arundo donax TaxID=35708 RepID=A0A0A9DTT6_ARUDO
MYLFFLCLATAPLQPLFRTLVYPSLIVSLSIRCLLCFLLDLKLLELSCYKNLP